MRKSVLVAAMPDADARLSVILGGQEVHFVRALHAAEAALAARSFDLALIDLRFDDSRMFDLLRHIRTRSQLDRMRVICVRAQRAKLASISQKGLEIAVKALGGQGFIDLAAFADDASGNAAIRAMVDEMLAA